MRQARENQVKPQLVLIWSEKLHGETEKMCWAFTTLVKPMTFRFLLTPVKRSVAELQGTWTPGHKLLFFYDNSHNNNNSYNLSAAHWMEPTSISANDYARRVVGRKIIELWKYFAKIFQRFSFDFFFLFSQESLLWLVI